MVKFFRRFKNNTAVLIIVINYQFTHTFSLSQKVSPIEDYDNRADGAEDFCPSPNYLQPPKLIYLMKPLFPYSELKENM